ncbi:hypothetical protein SKAU_G00399480 [Synaphobranchus kaupii]|uniref:Uncharacterized protein n=1 Tax=Synaphobranchus kaupii TaxID=118154 RepID=A0A9Q1E8R5_SYNKA|nr:hypothetical protein SKAU_G00399480 [Synaphobranchus kaupii]
MRRAAECAARSSEALTPRRLLWRRFADRQRSHAEGSVPGEAHLVPISPSLQLADRQEHLYHHTWQAACR